MSREAKVLSGIVAAIVVGMVGLFLATNKPDATLKPTADAGKLVRDDSYKQGTSSKVTIVEFGDYQCPACGNAYPNLKKVVAENKDSVTFVFRNYPLPMHKNAKAAAEAAEAAGAQGKYWEMHDMLYDNQTAWQSSGTPSIMFADYATKIGLDVDKFRGYLNANDGAARIKVDQDDGDALKVSSTPTIYVNGKQVADYSYDSLAAAVSDALKTAQ